MEASLKRVLLIVDDLPEVARGLRRFLRKDFDVVYEAQTQEQAEEYLASAESPPTHLICDHYLGKGIALGADLIPAWREKYPQVRVAVLLTGSEVSRFEVRAGIDKVFSKPVEPRELLQFLLAGEDAAARSGGIARDPTA